MDSLALPKTVTYKENEGKIDDVDAIVKKLIRGQQRKKSNNKSAAPPSAAANNNSGPDLRRLAQAGVEHVEPRKYPPPSSGKIMAFRCHGCGQLCRDSIPFLYPVALDKGRDLYGHIQCLYDVPRGDNGLVTITGGLNLEPIESAFVFRSIKTGAGETSDSYISV